MNLITSDGLHKISLCSKLTPNSQKNDDTHIAEKRTTCDIVIIWWLKLIPTEQDVHD